ncbi:gliding motility-associated C-terminal domain-containing protein [Dyadobacter luticola]|uniref:WG repeat-containing protein n=1 Tax=Dyadobacter luticola TaxID=1979387 RepID=A0A5R9KS52_9BACT|nr:gliding motility-associated C-terminal domain-containing protein [Dyadobacter luticola]TLU98948.1 hypothetical protein FEN17_20375 [Dyadobacter luticola]
MKNYILIFFITFTFLNCNAQAPENPVPIPEGYESCCGTKPVTFEGNGTRIYIPNVFTPNGDGINDIFMPSINSEVLALVNLTILTPNKDTLLWRGVTFVDAENLRENAWDGMRYDGSVYSGPFFYGMEVQSRDHHIYVIEGEACAIPCKKEMAVFKTKDGCFYPAQVGKDGELDKTRNNLEKECF